MRARRIVSKLAICFGFLLCLVVAFPGQAAWLEEGPGSSATAAPRWTPAPTPWIHYPPPTPTPHHSDPGDRSARAIRSFLSGAYLGSSYGWGGLTIVPILVSSGTATTSMRSLESALRSGDLIVREYGSGSVPTVEMENRGRTPVFLLAGEIVLGGKQDRVIRQDTVIGAHSTMQVDVYCVEQGRWASSASAFAAAPYAIADRDLRSKAAAGAGQDDVWEHVAKESEARGVRSPTASYGDVVASPEVSRRLDEYVSRCPRPSPWRGRAVGAVFMAGGVVLGVDLFGDPGLLSALWPKLVRSYAQQAMRDGYSYRHHGGDTTSASSVLEALRAAWPTWDGSAGAAPRHRLSIGGYDAWAVSWSDGVVHVAALPGARYYEPPPPPYYPYERHE